MTEVGAVLVNADQGVAVVVSTIVKELVAGVETEEVEVELEESENVVVGAVVAKEIEAEAVAEAIKNGFVEVAVDQNVNMTSAVVAEAAKEVAVAADIGGKVAAANEV